MSYLYFFKSRLIILSHIIKEIYFTLTWYTWKILPYNRTAVFIVDGRIDSCGMTDRFKGAVSLYCWAKQNDIPFRISYTSPFKLTDFLIPNKYDWIPQKEDYVQSARASKVIYAIGEPDVEKRFNPHSKKQIHFYGNRDLLNNLGIPSSEWGGVFSRAV